VALVVTLMVIYLVMLYLCIRCDIHDQKKGSLVHLVDNLAKFQQRYIITFETGFRKGAGTTAKVGVTTWLSWLSVLHLVSATVIMISRKFTELVILNNCLMCRCVECN